MRLDYSMNDIVFKTSVCSGIVWTAGRELSVSMDKIRKRSRVDASLFISARRFLACSEYSQATVVKVKATMFVVKDVAVRAGSRRLFQEM